MIELAEKDEPSDVLSGISDLTERLRKRAEIRLQITTRKSVQENQPDRIAELLVEAADKLDGLAEELTDTQTKLALALSREQELIDEIIPLKGERALINAGKEYKRYKINPDRRIDTTQIATREEGSLDAAELYKQFKTTLRNQVVYLPEENHPMTPTGYRSEVFLDKSTSYKYEFEFAYSDYPWYVRRVKFEG
jgi:organic radical activating enzyme